jgi:hypothetical protein
VNYSDIYFILCLNTTEDNMVLYPNELGGRFKKYMDLKIKRTVYKFICTYVQRIKLDVKCKKLLTKNPGALFFCKITPSDISYVLAIIKNGKDLWEQAKKRQVGDPRASPEIKARPLISAGE